MELPTLYLCRHGDTAWSTQRRMAGTSDIELTDDGEKAAGRLRDRLACVEFAHVFCSPMKRAKKTAGLAGYLDRAVIEDRIREFGFGEYEGLLRQDVEKTRPGWTYMRDGCPGGDNATLITQRVDSVLADLRLLRGNILLFSHSVLIRVMAARWLGLGAEKAGCFLLLPASVSMLGFDHVDDSPNIMLWNDTAHLKC